MHRRPVSDFQDVGPLAALAPGQQQTVLLGANALLLCHEASSGRIWAMRNSCPHAFQPLAGGVVRDGTLQCPKHGACFDLSTGRPMNPVTTRPLTVHTTRVEDGRIFVSLEPLAAPLTTEIPRIVRRATT